MAIRQPKCGKCGSFLLRTVDGKDIGGMPGIKYQACDGCGWSRAITQRPRREKLRERKG